MEEGAAICKLCGRVSHRLDPHIVKVHDLSLADYKEQFPDSITRSERYTLSGNHWSVDYWLAKGYSPKKAKLLQQKQHDKYNDKRISYWLARGYSETEAMEEISKRQLACNSKVVQRSQSKAEREILAKLSESFPVVAQVKIDSYRFDIGLGKKLIEYNGDYWHCNPRKYSKDYFHKQKKMYAKDVWTYDENKILCAKKYGFEVRVIWGDEYRKNKEKVFRELEAWLSS